MSNETIVPAEKPLWHLGPSNIKETRHIKAALEAAAAANQPCAVVMGTFVLGQKRKVLAQIWGREAFSEATLGAAERVSVTRVGDKLRMMHDPQLGAKYQQPFAIVLVPQEVYHDWRHKVHSNPAAMTPQKDAALKQEMLAASPVIAVMTPPDWKP